MIVTKNLPVPTADEINKAHQFARESAGMAVEHAIRCGQLLAAKKAELRHGEFEQWVEANCEFAPRAARKYMQVAGKAGQNGTAVPFSSLRDALGYEPSPKPVSLAPAIEARKSTPEVTPEQRKVAAEVRESINRQQPKPEPVEVDPDEPERPDDVDEDAALEAAEREYMASAEKALGTDAMAEIKRLTAELASVKLSRDGYMDGKATITKMLKSEQRKTAKLEKRVKELERENQSLRERVAIMEQAA